LVGRAAAYARAILRNRHDAEDAVQQAALRAWERIDRYDPSRPFKGWWFAVLRNCCIDIQRVRQPFENLDGQEPVDDRSAATFDWRGLEDALAKLSESHREILRLRYFGDLSYDELAETLDIPRGTVMSRLHLARKALSAVLSKETV